jgi:hypothetical protein
VEGRIVYVTLLGRDWQDRHDHRLLARPPRIPRPGRAGRAEAALGRLREIGLPRLAGNPGAGRLRAGMEGGSAQSRRHS